MHVAIVGAGVIGAMSVWRLARRGIEVTLFDRYAPAHDRSATGGESRIFRVACKEGARHVPLVRESLAMWRELESETDRLLLYQTGVATISAAHASGMRAIRETAAQFDLRLEALERDLASERFPAVPSRARRDDAVRSRRRRAALRSRGASAVALGANLRTYTSVDAIESFDDHVALRISGAKQTFFHVVMAPGGWASFDPALAALPLVTRRISLGWFAPRSPSATTSRTRSC
ncbi:unnamed protein product [Candidatus Paraburkholderia kirkii UZHbot1]|uniref:WGS project CAFE00000000 data, contig bkir_c65 n=1 Tax=Candidatus Paraburkholderia kirkii UZHbot1 TaxID=1055526 RepID=U3UB49_9BURK|nr:unnamed protein product [Candidatus Paraburkholderia kirkii UZHbot1]